MLLLFELGFVALAQPAYLRNAPLIRLYIHYLPMAAAASVVLVAVFWMPRLIIWHYRVSRRIPNWRSEERRSPAPTEPLDD